jgi:16S rRNA (cytosine1402-N4)-methyltransferase
LKSKSESNQFHKPVLLNETIKYLAVEPGELYVDATVGGGGHAAEILAKGGKVIGIDQDPSAVTAAIKHLRQACPDGAFWIKQGNFADLEQIIMDLSGKTGEQKVAGVLFDLGVSSHQLDAEGRGFSFQKDEELDMRMNPNQELTAKALINNLKQEELYEIFAKFAQEKLSKFIAEDIIRARREEPIETTGQLAEIVKKVYAEHYQGRSRIHPATKVFQALRIVVNQELKNLQQALPQAAERIKQDGRLAVISFHEGEDRIVKQYLRKLEDQNRFAVLTKHPIQPAEEEINKNYRSRSAKLRAGRKL